MDLIRSHAAVPPHGELDMEKNCLPEIIPFIMLSSEYNKVHIRIIMSAAHVVCREIGDIN